MKITIDKLIERPLSFSSMKEFAKSPRHYIKYISAERTPPTDAMKLGLLVHCMLLTPEYLNESFAVAPDVNKRTKDGKAEFNTFCSQHPDKTVVSSTDFEYARKIADVAMSNPKIYDAVYGCYIFEHGWDAEINDLPYRGFYDGQSNDYILEVKTTSDSHPRSVMTDFVKRKYHMQAALYNLVSSLPILYVVIDTTDPALSYVAKAHNEYVDLGKKDILELNDKFKRCMEMDLFDKGYDYSGDIVIKLPWSVEK